MRSDKSLCRRAVGVMVELPLRRWTNDRDYGYDCALWAVKKVGWGRFVEVQCSGGWWLLPVGLECWRIRGALQLRLVLDALFLRIYDLGLVTWFYAMFVRTYIFLFFYLLKYRAQFKFWAFGALTRLVPKNIRVLIFSTRIHFINLGPHSLGFI